MKSKKFLRSAAAVTLALSTQAFAGGRIIGGEKVRAGDPIKSSTVLIIGDTYTCTGSLIARDIVVTAAHCVADDIKAPTDPKKINLIFGLTLPASGTGITNYVYNPGWKGSDHSGEKGEDEHDIALIRFDGELPEGYAPAALLDPSVPLKPGADVTLAGYGIDTLVGAGNRGEGTLRKVGGIPVLQDNGSTEVILDQSKTGACHGDSGGPAFLEVQGKNYLWGVTARGDKNCETSIYTRIAAYSDFIGKAEDSLRSQNKNAGASAAERGLDRQRQAGERALRTAGAMAAASFH